MAVANHNVATLAADINDANNIEYKARRLAANPWPSNRISPGYITANPWPSNRISPGYIRVDYESESDDGTLS